MYIYINIRTSIFIYEYFLFVRVSSESVFSNVRFVTNCVYFFSNFFFCARTILFIQNHPHSHRLCL